MAKIAKNLTELIGNTPMLGLNNYTKKYGITARLLAKLEYFNPLGSVKDRVGFAMIEDAEKRGLLKKQSTVIEPTSGNTGIGLAFTAAIKGYRLILTMPETMSLERRSLLKALGAEIVLTDGLRGMNGAIEEADRLAEQIEDSYIPRQFDNPVNPDIHRKTTALEIWNDLQESGLRADFLVSGVGTGGTITGVGEVLKEKNPEIKIIAAEPFDSPVLSGAESGSHKLQGIGAGFIPKVCNTDIIDEVIKVTNQQAYEVVRRLAVSEGLLVGISSGAAVFAATEIALRNENKAKTIAVILPDSGERYLSVENLFL